MISSMQAFLPSFTLFFEIALQTAVLLPCPVAINNESKAFLKEAKLKINACIEDIDYKTPRGIDQSVIMSLISCDWIRHHQNIIITGPTGVGKTFLACALANKASREGYRSFYIRSPKLYYELAVSRGDGSYGKVMNKLARANVLVIDDLGLAPMGDAERRDLLEIIEDRHGNAFTIITSQLPIDNWHEQIGDPTIADAILDVSFTMLIKSI